MKLPRDDHKALSCRFYAKLLSLYPKSFRDLFGDQMNQLFRDQYRDAQNLGRAALVGFWIRIFSDFFQTAVREHWNNLIKNNMNAPFKALFRKPEVSFKKLFFTILLTCIAILSIKIALEPRIYQSIARFEISRTGVMENKDPYFIETEIAKITSRSVLESTIRSSGLERTLERQLHYATTPEEQYRFLRNCVDARRNSNTSLIELRVRNEEPGLAEQITLAMIENYQNLNRQSGTDIKVSVIDRPVAAQRAVQPNIPANLTLGFFASLLVAGLFAWGLSAILSRPRLTPVPA